MKKLIYSARSGLLGLLVFILFMSSATAFAQVPNVDVVSPAQNELNVSVNTNIWVTFDTDMSPATINNATFIVNARSTGRHIGAIAWDGADRRATFDPSDDFDDGEVVTVVLTTGIESATGDPLANSFSWSFTIGVDDGTGVFPSHSVCQVGDWPNSVFTADLDGDGDLDLAVANREDNNVSVLLNNGDGTFADQEVFSVGDNPSSVFAADLDGDGDLDLATANFHTDRVWVLLNDGDGNFSSPSDFIAGNGPNPIFAADLDGDGDLDLVTALTADGILNWVSVLLNEGDGTFATRKLFLVGMDPFSVFAADLDGDGDLDLVTANQDDNNVSVLLNRGNATFDDQEIYEVGNGPHSVVAADVNGDGDLDLVTANRYSDDVSVLLNNGDGTFPSHQEITVGDHPVSVFAADLDGDGDIDLATANHVADDVSVLLNDGDGTFDDVPPTYFPVGDGPFSVFVADLDGDGDLDLAVANMYSDNVSVLVNGPSILTTSPAQNELSVPVAADISVTFDMDMNAATINPSTFIVNARSTGLHQGAIAYDNQTRTATFNPFDDFAEGEVVTVLLTTGIESAGGIPLANSFSWSFTIGVFDGTGVFGHDLISGVVGAPVSVFAADLNGDGDLDLATANFSANNVSVLLYDDGLGAFVPHSQSPFDVGDAPTSVFAADLDGDGDLDLAVANDQTDDVSVLLNDGSGFFDPHPQSPFLAGDAPHSVFAADLDGDGDLDLTVANINTNLVSVLRNNGSGFFDPHPQSPFEVGDRPRSVIACDLDGDGDLDLATANQWSNDVWVLLNDGSGDFDPHPQSPFLVGDGPHSVFAADLDSDGDLDLATANWNSDNVSVLLNNGDGAFPSHQEITVGDHPRSVIACDLDGDEDLDLVTANELGDNVSVLFNDGDGGFDDVPHQDFPVGDNPIPIFAADLDGDGDLDLAVANASSDNISILLNGFLRPHITATTPEQNELAVPVAANISVTFDLDMDETTINPSTFLVNARSTGLHQGAINFNKQNSTAVFDPFDDFAEGEVVTVILTTGIESAEGIPLANGFSWSFTIGVFDGTGMFGHDLISGVVGAPVSVFAFDLEGDGDLDLATANFGLDSVHVLLNNGDGDFTHGRDLGVGDGPTSVFAADLDGDGDLDLAVTNRDDNNVSVLLNTGDGFFAHNVDYSVGLAPHSVIACDLDGDGDLDLATANRASDNVSVLWNKGNGTFDPHEDHLVGDSPRSVFAADLDGDGDFDLATANELGDNASVLLNNGDGTFATHVDFDVGDTPMSVFAADLDGDGDLDLTTANWDSDNVSVLLNHGNGTFAPHSDYSGVFGTFRYGPRSVFAADLDGDGDLDIVTADELADSVSVLLNNGDGTFDFLPHAIFLVGDNPLSVFAADLDGDGDLDLAVANAFSDDVSILWNEIQVLATFPEQNELNVPVNANITVNFNTDMDETTINPSTFLVNARSTGLREGQINFNKQASTAIFNPFDDFAEGEVVTVVLTTDIQSSQGVPLDNSFVWSFTTVVSGGIGVFDSHVDFQAGDHPSSVFAGDLDGDGDLDLATGNYNSDNVSVLLNNGDGDFAPHVDYPVGHVPNSIFAADLDGDGDLDLVAANFYSGNVSVLLNDGDGDFAPHEDFTVDAGPYSVIAADLDGDGDLDLATGNLVHDNVSVLLNYGDANFASPLVYHADHPLSLFAADLDGDGDLDLTTANHVGDNVSVLLNDGFGAFDPHPQSPFDVGDHPSSVFAADLDGDGDLDLVTANLGSDNVSVLLNNGDGTFEPQLAYPVGSWPRSVFVADLDGDGDLDLVTADESVDRVSVLLNDGDGTFDDVPHVDYAVGTCPRFVFVADLDGDGDLDLATANYHSDNVSVLLNQQIFIVTMPIPGTGFDIAFVGGGKGKSGLDTLAILNFASEQLDSVTIGAYKSALPPHIPEGSNWVHRYYSVTPFPGDTNFEATMTLFYGQSEFDCSGLSDESELGLCRYDDSHSTWTFEGGTVDIWANSITLSGVTEFSFWGITDSSNTYPQVICGDVNGDGVIDLGDVLYLISYLYKGGPAPDPLEAGDVNCDETIDLGDVLYLISYLYKGGPAPCSGKGGGILTNTSRLSGSLGHAEISLLLKSDLADENLTGFAKISPEGFDEVSEISVIGEFDRDVAGVHLEIDFNPDEVTLLDPALTPLTRSLQLFSGTKDGTQKIGIVDLSGKEFLPAGEGTLVNLKAKGKDLTSIKIKKAILLGMDAVPLDLELSGGLRFKDSKSSESVPQHFSLSQNYPNPFNPQTSIRYALPQDAQVRLIIYNILGKKVKTLVDEFQSAGYKTEWWDGKDEKGDLVASGVYLYRLEADKFSEVKKMLLVK